MCLAQCSHSFCEPQAGPRHAGHRDEAPEKPGGGLVNWRAPMNHCSFLPVSFSAGKPPRASLPRTPSAQRPGHSASERRSKQGFPGPLKRQGGPSDYASHSRLNAYGVTSGRMKGVWGQIGEGPDCKGTHSKGAEGRATGELLPGGRGGRGGSRWPAHVSVSTPSACSWMAA